MKHWLKQKRFRIEQLRIVFYLFWKGFYSEWSHARMRAFPDYAWLMGHTVNTLHVNSHCCQRLIRMITVMIFCKVIFENMSISLTCFHSPVKSSPGNDPIWGFHNSWIEPQKYCECNKHNINLNPNWVLAIFRGYHTLKYFACWVNNWYGVVEYLNKF